jgi:hypothetical protein
MQKSNFKTPTVPDFIQKIFLNQKNFQNNLDENDDEKKEDINRIMLSKEIYQNIVAKLNFKLPVAEETKEENETVIVIKKPDYLISEKVDICTRFKPLLNDTIFWCLFVRANGESFFQTKLLLKTNMTNLMMSEKKLMSDFFNKDTDKKMKNTNHKITLATAVELKSDLMTKPYMMNYSALITCCLFFKCPIYAVMEKNKTFLLFQPNDYVSDTDNAAEDPNAVVLYSEKGRMSMEMDATTKTAMITALREGTEYFKIEQYDKPLLAISNYKNEELLHIYRILFNDSPKLKKPEYYDKITEKCAVQLLEKFI